MPITSNPASVRTFSTLIATSISSSTMSTRCFFVISHTRTRHSNGAVHAGGVERQRHVAVQLDRQGFVQDPRPESLTLGRARWRSVALCPVDDQFGVTIPFEIDLAGL